METAVNRRRFFTFAGIGAALAAVGSGIAWNAHAHGRFGRGPIDPARLDEHLDRMLKHLYVEIDATEAQKQKLAPIVKGAARELLPLRETMREARRRGVELLSAPSIDRAAIEGLRSEQLRAAEAGSQRIARALADAAEVLTPEQRKTLAEHMQRRFARRHG
jgi:Spy/CpxP family protein refolding chaperone